MDMNWASSRSWWWTGKPGMLGIAKSWAWLSNWTELPSLQDCELDKATCSSFPWKEFLDATCLLLSGISYQHYFSTYLGNQKSFNKEKEWASTTLPLSTHTKHASKLGADFPGGRIPPSSAGSLKPMPSSTTDDTDFYFSYLAFSSFQTRSCHFLFRLFYLISVQCLTSYRYSLCTCICWIWREPGQERQRSRERETDREINQDRYLVDTLKHYDSLIFLFKDQPSFLLPFSLLTHLIVFFQGFFLCRPFCCCCYWTFFLILLLFYVLLSWLPSMWELNSLTSDGTHTPALEGEVVTTRPWGPNCVRLLMKHAQSLSHAWLCNPMGCSPPGSSVHGILQVRTLEWVAISFCRGSSWPRDRTCVSWTGRWILYHWPPADSSHSLSSMPGALPKSLHAISIVTQQGRCYHLCIFRTGKGEWLPQSHSADMNTLFPVALNTFWWCTWGVI